MEWINRMVRTNTYTAFIFFIIMPVNGILFERGQIVTAIILSLLHAPWFMQRVVKEER